MTQQKVIQRTGSPEAEIHIDSDLIKNLLSDQHPDLAGLPIELFGSGWDNVMFRLGRELCVRVPRRKLSADLICNEQQWLPQIAGAVSLPAPAPIRIGYPTNYYPWHWSVLPWIDGKSADEIPLEASQAKVLGEFLRNLHFEAPNSFPQNPCRGISLKEKNQTTLERFQRLSADLGNKIEPLLALWNRALSMPIDTDSRVIHGDLHPQNVLSLNGTIAGIIDWGDLCVGDIATDLSSAWMLFREPTLRKDFLSAYGQISENAIFRAEGWAISFGTALLDTGLVNNPRHEILGRNILENLLTQAPDR
jgi:aminoglycoside phosphotransferase (APT) family kinase protein